MEKRNIIYSEDTVLNSLTEWKLGNERKNVSESIKYVFSKQNSRGNRRDR